MVIFYHGDMDGISAANLYYRHCVSIETFTDFIEFEYENQNVVIEMVNKYAKRNNNMMVFVFVDCFPDEYIVKYILENHINVVVLDHHISKKESIDKFLQEGLINGLSYIGASATLITWCWIKFNKNIQDILYFLDKTKDSKKEQDENIPFAIKLVNSWDIWNGLYQDAEPYKIFFETQNFIPYDAKVKSLLEDNLSIRNAIRDGYTMMQFYHNWGQIYCERYGYEVKYKTNNFFVLNIGNANSKVFGDLINKYDAVITYCNNGEIYKCSIYSVKENFDCANFAENFGGGGHKGAAGFTFDTLPVWLMNKRSGLIFKEEEEVDKSKQRRVKRKNL